MTAIKEVPTYSGTIYLGLKHTTSGTITDISTVKQAIQKYVDTVGLCVSFTATEFIYTNGSEPGLIIGLINYPRFPSEFSKIEAQAIELAHKLKKLCRQERVSVVFPARTVMIEEDIVNGKNKNS